MFCLKCGEPIPDNSNLCPICGASIQNEMGNQAIVYASQINTGRETVMDKKPNRKIFKIILILSIISISIVGIILGIIAYRKSALKKELTKAWRALDGSLIKVLDIDDDKIVYRVETGYSRLDTTIAKYDWRVKDSTTIEVNRYKDKYEPFTIEISEDKKSLTITPALTSGAASEVWYDVGD